MIDSPCVANPPAPTIFSHNDILDEAVQKMADGMAIFDANGVLVFVNQRYRDLSPHVAELLIVGEKHETIIRAVHRSGAVDTRNMNESDFVEFAQRELKAPSGNTVDQLNDGRWIRFSGRKLENGHTVFVQTDISELRFEQLRAHSIEDELSLRSSQFQQATENMFAGFVMFNSEQEVITFNSNYVSMFNFPDGFVKRGVTRQSLMDKAVEMKTFIGENVERAQHNLDLSSENKTSSLFNYFLSDGKILQARRALTLDGGSMLLFLDITGEEKFRTQLELKNKQLSSSNEELQNFAYVASHDLQEPLRKIEAFSDRLMKKYADTLDDKGQYYLDRTQSAAGRMRQLINDLLAFSRSISTKKYERIKLDDVVADVEADLSIALEEKDACVEYSQLPGIEADAVQMRQLFQNLMSNSLKFSRESVTPVIKIDQRILAGTQNEPDKIEITMSDNGVGFDNRFKDQIFAIFKRLHARDEYEGTGIGLATCRKIVELHNGTIEARGTEGQGATFVITLPIEQVQSGESQ